MKNLILICTIFLIVSCIVPAAAGVAPIKDDGQLKYTNLGTTVTSYSMRPAGHAVYFENKDPIVITGVRIYGCKYGDNSGNVRFEIWDENKKTLYSDTVPYEKIPFTTAATQTGIKDSLSWAQVTLPEHTVTGNFYYVVFTDSAAFEATGHGMPIGFTQPTAAFTSHAVGSNPNKINEKTINAAAGTYTTDKVDWMIRPYYKAAPATTATTAPQTTAVTTQAAAAGTTTAAAQVTTVPATTAAAATTKSPVEICVIVAGAALGLLAIRRDW